MRLENAYTEVTVLESDRTESHMSVVDAMVAPAAPGADDPPINFSREAAAYARERDRLIREHLGRIALIRGDEVIGTFATADEAILEAFRRFGLQPVMLQEISLREAPDFVNLVDTRHPSFK